MLIANYIKSEEKIRDYFGITENYFIRPLVNKRWAVARENELSILSYWERNMESKKERAAIANKNGVPIIKKTEKYTLIVAIDCVKVCFVFSNALLAGEL